MKTAIQVNGLTKSYGANTVLDGVSFCVNEGEIFALLGVNGAGKTTTLECIEGLRKYDGGSIELSGRVGIQLQSSSLPASIKPMEAVRLFAKWNREKIDDSMLSALGIDELKKKRYESMSTGQKRRLHLALALINDPDIVFLDEPTAGLDVEGRVALHAQIRALKARGKTIVLASHDMAEVETLCDRIAILRGGKTAFLGSVAELTEKIGRRYNITVTTQLGEERFETEDIADAMLALLQEHKQKKLTVLDVKIDRGTLEQHFMDIAGRNYK